MAVLNNKPNRLKTNAKVPAAIYLTEGEDFTSSSRQTNNLYEIELYESIAEAVAAGLISPSLLVLNNYGSGSNDSDTLSKTLTDYVLLLADDGTVVEELRYKTGVATPVGSVIPDYVGQEFLDTALSTWYKSTGLTNSDWVALN